MFVPNCSHAVLLRTKAVKHIKRLGTKLCVDLVGWQDLKTWRLAYYEALKDANATKSPYAFNSGNWFCKYSLLNPPFFLSVPCATRRAFVLVNSNHVHSLLFLKTQLVPITLLPVLVGHITPIPLELNEASSSCIRFNSYFHLLRLDERLVFGSSEISKQGKQACLLYSLWFVLFCLYIKTALLDVDLKVLS
ncbi:hypothetical protein Tco_0525479 [Tanacetum coccineum]